jgi:hypothetical protein
MSLPREFFTMLTTSLQFVKQLKVHARRSSRALCRGKRRRPSCETLEGRALLTTIHPMSEAGIVPVWSGVWNPTAGGTSPSVLFQTQFHDGPQMTGGISVTLANGQPGSYSLVPTVTADGATPQTNSLYDAVLKGVVWGDEGTPANSNEPGTAKAIKVGTFAFILDPEHNNNPNLDTFHGTYSVDGSTHSLKMTYVQNPPFPALFPGQTRYEPGRGGGTGGGGGGGGQTTPDTATVTNIVGDVSVRSGDTEWHDATIGEKLITNDEIHTGPDSEATIKFSDGSFLQVRQLTETAIGQISGPVDLPKVRVLLKMGEVAAKVNHEVDQQGDFSIRTPNATASVRGCEFEVSYANKDSELLVFEGAVEDTPQNTRLRPELLKAGQEIQVWPKKEGPIKPTGGASFP